MPFTPPNPYGSYFEFGSPEAVAMSSFLPGGGSNLSPSATGLMGRGNGGFNPTTLEYAQARNREMVQNQYMAHVLRSDARAAMVGDRALDLMIPDPATRASFVKRMGGYGNINEVTSFLMNQPGISGYLGGSHASLGIGSMALATSGMSVNGYQYMGGFYAQNEMAKSIFGMVNNRFYGTSGASNLSMTSGLNRDQIGGIMTTAASQGAFSGMDLGKLSVTGGALSFSANSGTLEKIAKFTKTAAKALSGLIDIYGDQSVSELLQKAQAITGMDLSRIGNVDAMASRLSNLRSAAGNSGYDLQTVMDTAAGATAMGKNMGLRGSFAGAVGNAATLSSLGIARQMQANSNVFYLNTPSLHELAGDKVRDQVAMSRDPLGSRRAAVELMIQQGVISPALAGGLRDAASISNPRNVPALDNLIKEKTGLYLPAYIRSMGGADAIAASLDEGGKDRLIGSNAADMSRRQRVLMGRMATRALVGSTGSASDLLGIISDLKLGNAVSLMEAADSGDPAAMAKALNGDIIGSRDPSKYASMASRLSAGTGGRGAGILRMMQTAMNNNALTRSVISRSQIEESAASTLRGQPLIAADDIRGLMTGGLAQGLWARLGGEDPRSALGLLMMLDNKSGGGGAFARIAGAALNGRDSMNFNRDTYLDGHTLKDKRSALRLLENMQSGIGKLGPSGKAALEAFGQGFSTKSFKDITDPNDLAAIIDHVTNPAILMEATRGLETFNLDGAGTKAFVAKDVLSRFQGPGGKIAGMLAMTEALAKGGADPGSYRHMLEYIWSNESGKFVRGSIDHGKLLRGKETELKPGDLGVMLERAVNEMSNPRNLLGVPKSVLEGLVKTDPNFRQTIVDSLGNMANMGAAGFSKSDQNKARKIIDDLGGGVSDKVAMTMTGTMRLVGNDTFATVIEANKAGNKNTK